jgi:hypothetical protein
MVVLPFSYRVYRDGLQKIFSGCIGQMRVRLHMHAPALNPPRAGGLPQITSSAILYSDNHYYVKRSFVNVIALSMT